MISAKTSVGEDVESPGMMYELLATIKYWLAWDEFWVSVGRENAEMTVSL
jgi:hypothetical protein